MVQEILEDIQRCGIRTALILNTGISTIEPLQAIVEAMPKALHTRLANVYQGPRYRSEVQAIEEQSCGGHADEIETSILLAIDRQAVNLDKALAWTPAALGASGPFSRDPDAPCFSPTGVWGDPTLASKDKGHRLLAAMADDLLEIITMLQA